MGPVTPKRLSFTVYDETSYASGESRRPRGPRTSLTLLQPYLDLISTAETYFLNYYMRGLADSPSVSACMSECLIAWHSAKRQSEMVDLAVSSIALAIYSQTQNHPRAASAACNKYCHLLRLAQQRIVRRQTRLEERDVDECLLTIILMALYETTMHQVVIPGSDPRSSSQHSWSHHIGAMTVLKHWDNTFGNNAPSVIIQQTRQGLIRSSLLRNCALPGWLLNGSRFGKQNCDVNFDSILCQAVNLRHSFKANHTSSDLQLQKLAKLAHKLDQACIVWADHVPTDWLFQVHDTSKLSSIPEKLLFSSSVYTFTRQAYAAAWLQYLSTHILIISTYLSLAETLNCKQPYSHVNETTRFTLDMRMGFLARSFASTLPFALGRLHFEDVKTALSQGQSRRMIIINNDELQPSAALPTVWPLMVVSFIGGIDKDLQSWFRSQLQALANALGDGALKCTVNQPSAHNI